MLGIRQPHSLSVRPPSIQRWLSTRQHRRRRLIPLHTLSGWDDNIRRFGLAHNSGWRLHLRRWKWKWLPYLNGIPISVKPNGSNVLALKVSSQGNLFAQASNNRLWYAYLNFDWYPAGASATAGPIPLEANLSANLRTDLRTTTSIGTVVATISVKMSNGSPFAGTMSVAGGSTYVGVSGRRLITLL